MGYPSGKVHNRFQLTVPDPTPVTIPEQAPVYVGESYVVFGAAGWGAASVDLASLDGSNGFRIDGIDGSDHSGLSVSIAGDVNGDGVDDVIIGAQHANANGNLSAGESYIVFGSAGWSTASVDLASLDGSNGFRINGIDANDRSGWSVSSAGDVNGDGIDDVIIGALAAEANGNSYAGESYVVFGSAGWTAAAVDLAALDGTNGFRIDGIDYGDYSGSSVSSAGDVNGDGVDDVIIGASSADRNGNSYAGESYVVFGSGGWSTASVDLASLDGSNGFRIDGTDAYDYTGGSVSSAGDVNGDGIDDVIISASGAGESYVVFGSAGWTAAAVDRAALDGTNGFRIYGDGSGSSVSSAGDVNGDGIDDVIIGAPSADPNGIRNAGEIYVVFGSAGWTAAAVDLAALDGTNGFRIDGTDYGDRSGSSVSSAGDVNGDGIDDVIIGAYEADANGYFSVGESYVLFGGENIGQNTSPTGTVTIYGAAIEDATLTPDASTVADADGLGTLSYQWQRDGVNIIGATDATYTLTQADVGSAIRAIVSYTDLWGNEETIASTATATIGNINDAPTGAVTISGTVTEDQVLTATNTLADEDGIGTLSYQWQRGGQDISGATSDTYTLTQADVGADIRVVVSYEDGYGADESVTSDPTLDVSNSNDAPTGSVAISGTATQGATLTADTSGLDDPDGLGSFSYQWLRDGSPISGANAETYVLTQDDVDAAISVTVSYTDGYGTKEALSAESTPSSLDPLVKVSSFVNGAKQAEALIPFSLLPPVDNDFSLTIGGQVGHTPRRWNGELDEIRIWDDVRSDEEIQSSYSSALLGTEDNLIAYFDFETVTDDQFLNKATGESGQLIGDYVVAAGAPIVGGSSSLSLDGQGYGIIADNAQNPLDANGNKTIEAWVKFSDWASGDFNTVVAKTFSHPSTNMSYGIVRGGSEDYLTLTSWQAGGTENQVSQYLSPTVVSTDSSTGIRNGEWHHIAFTYEIVPTAVENVNDAPTGSVVILGTATQGEILTADASEVDDIDGLGAFSYQWLRDGTAINGATADTYELTQEDVGTAISVTVSYTDGYGADESVTSDPTLDVSNSNDAPTGSVAISGTATQGATLTADTSGLDDPDGLGSFSYQWLRDGSPISGANAETYVLTQDDVDAAISVTVSYTDGGGTAESVSSAPTETVEAAPVVPAFDIALASTSGNVATFEIYANELVDPDADGIGSFEFTLSHDPSDMLIDLDSFVAASGISNVPNYDPATGTLESAAFAFPNFTDLTAPIVTFSATILDTDNPLGLTLTKAIVDRVVQDDVIETFDFTSVHIESTVIGRGAEALTGVRVSYDFVTPSGQQQTIELPAQAAAKVSQSMERGSGGTVTAAKDIDEASEDAIGAFDALQALRLAVGLTKSDGTAEWHDYLAADINKDGRVGADDALDILKFAVGLTDGAPADWVFVDSDADWSGVNRSNTDYNEGIILEDVLVDTSVNMIGILVGDLDSSYAA